MSRIAEGISNYKKGKFEEALRLFELHLASDPNDATGLIYRARVFSRIGRFDDSLADFDRLLTGNPFDCDLISDRAVVLHLMKRNQEALSELDRAQNLDPKNPYRYSSRAFLKDRIGDLHGALADYEIALELDPEDAISLNNKGMVEERLGYLSRSKKSFEKADALIGYKPNQDHPQLKGENPVRRDIPIEATGETENTVNQKRLTVGHLWDTIKGIFTQSHTRMEFWEFLKGGLKRS
ncbi:tetratricopeptide repeat protein [Lunatimonas salinarum]|uniref:tetratricopeptide repeat protein n=1 Tax=Lunatimonas salinarum TaxID=1774590 RepID=UPI001ADF3DE7